MQITQHTILTYIGLVNSLQSCMMILMDMVNTYSNHLKTNNFQMDIENSLMKMVMKMIQHYMTLE